VKTIAGSQPLTWLSREELFVFVSPADQAFEVVDRLPNVLLVDGDPLGASDAFPCQQELHQDGVIPDQIVLAQLAWNLLGQGDENSHAGSSMTEDDGLESHDGSTVSDEDPDNPHILAQQI